MRFNRGEEEDFNLNVTSLVDIVLMLLIFFMVSSAYVDFTKRMDVQLPAAGAGGAMTPGKPYSIEIDGDGRIFMDGAQVQLGDIKGRIKQAARKSVVIRADKKLYYGLAVQVMGICSESGVNDIGLAVL
ncbi:MAG: biopolymer transporter ExbD [Nitrospinae bacterium]|nr:biopolymer transporter ExbD [Nitrospinota bacterium]